MNRPRLPSIGALDDSKSMIKFTKVGQTLEQSTSASGNVECGESLRKMVDIDDLKTDGDLETLKKKDPFLYYSIPAVRRAEFLNEDICVAKILRSEMPRHQSCPGRMMTDDHQPGPRSILRRSRISFECHESLAIGNMALFGNSHEVDDGDPILDVLELCKE